LQQLRQFGTDQKKEKEIFQVSLLKKGKRTFENKGRISIYVSVEMYLLFSR